MSLEGSYQRLGAANLRRIEQYVKRIESLMRKATGRFISLSTSVSYDREKDGQFYFSDYPEIKREVDNLVANLARGMGQTIITGTTSEWAHGAQDANDGILEYVMQKTGLTSRMKKLGISADELKASMVGEHLNNHDAALKAFQTRQIGGLNLSSRVWNLANQSRIEAELARSIASGTSADELAESMKELLNEPSKLFRRVRDEFGMLHLSKNAAAYNPGEGVYRSSFKNAKRLARTEINMAYRNAEQESYRDDRFVVGIEICRSNRHYECVVCESLKGRYPKDFKWSGWHPNCRCFMVPILVSDDEFIDMLGDDSILPEDSVNYIGDVPGNFKDWVSDNSDRITQAEMRGSLPYFIKDNKAVVDAIVKEAQQSFSWSIESVQSMISSGYAFKTNSGEQLVGKDALQALESCVPLSHFNLPRIERGMQSIYDEYGFGASFKRVVVDGQNAFRLTLDGDYFRLERQFSMLDGEIRVEHQSFELATQFQGKGASKKVFKVFLNEYKRSKFSRIDLRANIDVGGYCWARYGFSTDSKTARAFISLAEAENTELGIAFKKAYDRYYIDHRGLFPMRLFAEIPGAKAILYGSSWDGVMFLDDPKAMSYLRGYLNGV